MKSLIHFAFTIAAAYFIYLALIGKLSTEFSIGSTATNIIFMLLIVVVLLEILYLIGRPLNRL